MSSQPWRRRYQTRAGAAIALIAVVWCAPSNAVAGCSHYVVARTGPQALTAHLDLLDGNPSSASDSPLSPLLPSGPRKPCSGPLCSKAPAVPLPAPTIAGLERIEHWGWLPISPTFPGSEGKLLPPQEGLARPVLRGPSIDRPPRVSLAHRS